MRLTALLSIAAASAALLPAAAQTRAPQARVFTLDTDGPAEHRAALGVSTRSTGSLRDTLGLLVSAVTAGSPAERAGLEEGSRIAAINGVSLRASAADLEDSEVSGALSRRLVRELAKAKPGDEVELRVYRDGRTTAMRVRTADSDSLFRRREGMTFTRASLDDRPVLGLSVTSTGNRRDTLGVFVTSVSDSTPAARAGIEEGNRIAAINGVSLRVASEDATDRYLGGIKAQRLQREIAQLKPGSDVTLRVYANGQFRDVRMKVARAGDLPHDRNRMLTIGGNGFDGFGGFGPGAPFPPMRLEGGQRIRVLPRATTPPSGTFRIDASPELRRKMDDLRSEVELMGPELESIGPALERLRPELERIRTEVPRAMREARAAAQATRVM
jgi:predicted metalloprotease with PDZ domain